jgi:uncharacterized surface protein with fasciclin (FAS1) repeats
MMHVNVVIRVGSSIGAAVVPLLSGPTLVADRAGAEAVCDVTDPASVAALVARVDRLEALVVTAGVSPVQADARTVFAVDLLGMARVLGAFDPLVGPGSVAICIASMAGHLLQPPPEALAALDDPLSGAVFALPDDPAHAYVLAKRGVLRIVRRLAVPRGRRGGRILSVSPGFETLVAALQQAGLIETQKGPGPFSVFAPTDEAFAKIPKADLDARLADKAKLTKVLTHHVVSGKVMAADVVKLDSVKTVEGGSVAVKPSGGSVSIDEAKVVKTDIMTSNGVIHVIDTVLMPGS